MSYDVRIQTKPRVDLTGRRYGQCLVLKREGCRFFNGKNPNSRTTTWKCLCDCGKEFITTYSALSNRKTSSCGCYRDNYRLKDRIGERHGLWVVLSLDIERTEIDKIKGKRRRRYWMCECDCGTIRSVEDSVLSMKASSSCGCMKKNFQQPYLHREPKSFSKYLIQLKAGLKTRGKKLDISDDITIEFLEELLFKQDNKCALSGIAIDNTNYSLDRIDTNQGYYPSNVQWVHKCINFMKNTLNIEDFILFCNNVAKTHPREVDIQL